jgi:hypothetical protein
MSQVSGRRSKVKGQKLSAISHWLWANGMSRVAGRPHLVVARRPQADEAIQEGVVKPLADGVIWIASPSAGSGQAPSATPQGRNGEKNPLLWRL